MNFKKPNPLDYYDQNPYIEGSQAYIAESGDYTINEQIKEEMDTEVSKDKTHKSELQYRSIDVGMPRLTDN